MEPVKGHKWLDYAYDLVIIANDNKIKAEVTVGNKTMTVYPGMTVDMTMEQFKLDNEQ